ncbi:hypothetical protein DMENIID0001_058840 [Sergentomyia squamirostris]
MKFLLIVTTIFCVQDVLGKRDAFKPIHSWEKDSPRLKNSIPTTISHNPKQKELFMSIPRTSESILDTLSEIKGHDRDQKSSTISAFSGSVKTPLISVQRAVVDECQRLWVIDSGRLEDQDVRGEYKNESAFIVAFSLKKSGYPEVIRHKIPTTLVREPQYFGQLAVDVINPGRCCRHTYIYIPNYSDATLYVYDNKRKKMWKFNDDSFQHEKLTYPGNDQGYKYGIHTVAVGERDSENHRTAYYIAGSGTKLWSVNTKILRNKGSAFNPEFLGDHEIKPDALAMAYDSKTKVLFFGASNTKQIICWNTEKQFNEQNLDVVFQSDDTMSVRDISIDHDGIVWILAEVLQSNSVLFLWKKSKPLIKIWRADAALAIDGTRCSKDVTGQFGFS